MVSTSGNAKGNVVWLNNRRFQLHSHWGKGARQFRQTYGHVVFPKTFFALMKFFCNEDQCDVQFFARTYIPLEFLNRFIISYRKEPTAIHEIGNCFSNHLFLFNFRPRITKGNRSIKHKCLVTSIRVQTKISLALKLEPATDWGMFQARFSPTS